MLATYDTRYGEAAKSRDTRQSSYIAGQISGTIGHGDVLTSPELGYGRVDDLAAHVAPDRAQHRPGVDLDP